MAESTPAAAVPLEDRLKALASFEPASTPVISLYLDLRPNQHGRDDYHAFVRKVLPERMRALAQPLRAHAGFEADLARIQGYLDQEVDRAANSLAIFASADAHLFQAIQLHAPLPEHWLFVGSRPHLYLLARLIDRYPRYAAVLLDRNKARIFVFGLASMEHAEHVAGEKTRRHSQGGWSQARFQRHIENLHAQHVKEVVDTLDVLVRDEGIAHVVAAGSDEALALLREHLPAHLTEKLNATTKLDVSASDAEVLQTTLESLQAKQVETDNQRIQELLDAWRSGGRGVAGPEATLRALEMGQVDELIITGSPDLLKPVQRLPDDAAPGPVYADTSAPQGAGDEMTLKLASELIARAHQTSARIRFIEDSPLLADVGGVGALLRFRV
jgi:peptide chain release factor subunit 1